MAQRSWAAFVIIRNGVLVHASMDDVFLRNIASFGDEVIPVVFYEGLSGKHEADAPKFDSVEDVMKWAEKLEFINQLPKPVYEKFLETTYRRLTFFQEFFDRLHRLRIAVTEAGGSLPQIKQLIDDGTFQKAVELADRIASVIDIDNP